MGQLYYPPPRRRSPLLDVAGLGLQLYGLKQRGDIAAGQQDIEREQLDIQQRKAGAELGTGVPTEGLEKGAIDIGKIGTVRAGQQLAEQRLKFDEEQADITRKAFATSRQPLTIGMVKGVEGRMKNMDKQLGFSMSKGTRQWLDTAEVFAGQGQSRADFYTWSRSNEQLKQPILDEITASMGKADISAKDQEKLQKAYDEIDGNWSGFVDSLPFFQNSVRARQAAEAESKLETLKATKEPKLTTLSGYDAQGNLVTETVPKRVGVTKPTTIKTLKAPRPKETELDKIANRYQQQVGRYGSAKRGVGQFIEDPNKEQIAAESLRAAENIAIQYVKKGGDARDLGITPKGIRQDYQDRKITKKKANSLLKSLFGEAPK